MNNIFQNLPKDLSSEVFEILASSPTVKIERIISKGHTSPAAGWYDQPQNEWVIVLKGEAILTFDRHPPVRLIPGSYFNIPAHQKHRVHWTDPTTETIWLAVHH